LKANISSTLERNKAAKNVEAEDEEIYIDNVSDMGEITTNKNDDDYIDVEVKGT